MNRNVDILIQGLSIGYKHGSKKIPVKESVNLTAKAGELIALVGSNGIGKSTLLRTITGFQNAFGGSVLFNEVSIDQFSAKELAKTLSFVSTEVIHVQNLRVKELLALGRYPYTNFMGSLTDNDRQLIDKAIVQVGLQGYEDRMINQLSDGERQRAMIARTLVQDTPVIVLDEPTAFLDIRNKYEIIHLLHEFVRKEGKTIIFSSHDLNIATSEVDKIWLMLDNSVVEGAPEDLILMGNFSEMFHSEKVVFNNESGDFMLKKKRLGTYSIETDDQLAEIWTAKALQRIGLYPEDKPDVHIKIEKTDTGWVWKVEMGESVQVNSLYELTALLYQNLDERLRDIRF